MSEICPCVHKREKIVSGHDSEALERNSMKEEVAEGRLMKCVRKQKEFSICLQRQLGIYTEMNKEN